MKHIPLKAKVDCSDGHAGESVRVIVDPDALRVTRLVVKESQRPHVERLVPVAWVADTAHDGIRLGCTREELAAMDPFVVTEHRMIDMPSSAGGYATMPVYTPHTVEVKHEQVPEGQLALREGLDVEATDGKVGRIDELLADETTGEITHILLRQGHLWGKHDIVVPVSAIDHMGQDHSGTERVVLKLDKRAISSFSGLTPE
jgi:hypothetical protein